MVQIPKPTAGVRSIKCDHLSSICCITSCSVHYKRWRNRSAIALDSCHSCCWICYISTETSFFWSRRWSSTSSFNLTNYVASAVKLVLPCSVVSESYTSARCICAINVRAKNACTITSKPCWSISSIVDTLTIARIRVLGWRSRSYKPNLSS